MRVRITNPKEALKELRQIIGATALRSLQNGSRLMIWRNSSPHNWWVENSRGQMLWHSQQGQPRPSLRHYFVKVRDSKEVVSYGPFGMGFLTPRDAGMPQKSEYRLRKTLCPRRKR